MPFVMKEDETLDPLNISLLSAKTQVTHASHSADFIEQARFTERLSLRGRHRLSPVRFSCDEVLISPSDPINNVRRYSYDAPAGRGNISYLIQGWRDLSRYIGTYPWLLFATATRLVEQWNPTVTLTRRLWEGRGGIWCFRRICSKRSEL